MFQSVQVIGTWINVALYTLEAVQVYHYFRSSGRSKTDSKILKCAVILNFILDSLATIAICGLVFMVSSTTSATHIGPFF